MTIQRRNKKQSTVNKINTTVVLILIILLVLCLLQFSSKSKNYYWNVDQLYRYSMATSSNATTTINDNNNATTAFITKEEELIFNKKQKQQEENGGNNDKTVNVTSLITAHATMSQGKKKYPILALQKPNGNNIYNDFSTRTFASSSSSLPATKKLRLDYSNLNCCHSPLTKQIISHQSNCSLPIGHFCYRNRFGLGSDLHLYSQGLCNGMEKNLRLQTIGPWIWNDKEQCPIHKNNQNIITNSMDCYFHNVETKCPQDSSTSINNNNNNKVPRLVQPSNCYAEFSCESIIPKNQRHLIRDAGIEYLFTRVSPLVIQEAERQLAIVFGNDTIPNDLITVHVRWGDKHTEMKLVPMEGYIKAILQILTKRIQSKQQQRNNNDDITIHELVKNYPATIYLATEDANAVEQFLNITSQQYPHWNIYLDHFYTSAQHSNNTQEYNNIPKLSKSTNGKIGLITLGSLLVSMEAQDYILTTSSNWSRVMDEIRRLILDPNCNNCTSMIDLRPPNRRGAW